MSHVPGNITCAERRVPTFSSSPTFSSWLRFHKTQRVVGKYIYAFTLVLQRTRTRLSATALRSQEDRIPRRADIGCVGNVGCMVTALFRCCFARPVTQTLPVRPAACSKQVTVVSGPNKWFTRNPQKNKMSFSGQATILWLTTLPRQCWSVFRFSSVAHRSMTTRHILGTLHVT